MSQRIHPIWPSWAALAGLVLAFLGERALNVSDGVQLGVRAVAALLVVVAVGARISLLMYAAEDRRAVSRSLALYTVGVAVAMALYASLPWAEGTERLTNVVWGIWPVLLAVSAFPLAAIEIAVTPVAYNPIYEQRHVAHAQRRGLGLALLLSVLFYANFLGSRHDVKWDLSSGSKAVASAETRQAVSELTKDVEVVLFWPKANEVGDVVERYFEPLTQLNPKLTVVRKDHALAVEQAKSANVKENGWVALYRGSAHETVRVGDKARTARSALRRLDRNLLKALLKVTLRERVAYYTTGHGERAFRRPDKEDQRKPMTIIRRQLEGWQFQLKPFGVGQGSSQAIPEDASLIIAAGPEKPFLEAEIEVIKEALGRGLRLLLLLEAERDAAVPESLLSALGLSFDRRLLASERAFAPITRTKADRSTIITDRYSSHPSLSYMTRDPRFTGYGKTGSLKKVEAKKPADKKLKTEIVISAVEKTFIDLDGDLDLDTGEPVESFGLGAAVTRTSTEGAAKETRVFVLADTDTLADDLIRIEGNFYLFRDLITWLQIDQEPIVPTVSEKDVRIVHRAENDALLFYGTTFGAPLLVLLAGYLATRRRRSQ